MKVELKGKGLTVNGQRANWWQTALALLSAPILFSLLLLDALLKAPGKLGMWFCNTLGRAGLPELGGGLLQLRYPTRRIAWHPEGLPAARIALLERHGARIPDWARQPHFECIRRVSIKVGTKRNGRE
jgi:hypothetical protein